MSLLRRIQMLLHRKRFDSELEEEMRLHMDLREEEQRFAGATPEEARRQSRRDFGNPTVLRERSHAAWGWGWLESLVQDIHYALRSMTHAKALTLMALLSLSLGIGANVAIFSFLDALVLRSLPVTKPAELVQFGKGDEAGVTGDYGDTTLYSYPFFREFRKSNTVFSSVAAVFSFGSEIHGTLDHSPSMQKLTTDTVSGTFFSTLGVEPAMGRFFRDEEDRVEGKFPVAVVSYAFWQSAFQGTPDILNHTVKLADTTFNIIGVAPPGFFGIEVGHAPDFWVPMAMMQSLPSHHKGYADGFFQSNYIFGRLKPGVTRAQAEAETNLLYQHIVRSFPNADLNAYNLSHLQNAHVQLTDLTTGRSFLRSTFSDPLKILMGVAALVLLITCANIANLLLARATTRTHEFAVRQAFGAQRLRLIRQLLTESLLLSVAGAVLGVVLALAADRLLLRMISGGPDANLLPLDISLNLRLLSFTLFATIGTAVLFGLVPALRASRVAVNEGLKESRRSNSNSRSPLSKGLVIAQIALSLVLSVASVLFLRTLVNLTRVDTGFPRNGVMLVDIDSSVLGMKGEDPRMVAMFQEIEQRAGALPQVRAASFAAFTFAQGSWNGTLNVPGMPFNEKANVKHNVIGNSYFNVMQMPLLAGRAFGPQDNAASNKVVILSESVARDYFPPGVNPIGRHIYYGKDPNPEKRVEVIGIVRDVKFGSLDEPRQYIDYYPNPQHPSGYGTLVVRYDGNFATMSAAVQNTIHSVNRNLVIDHVTTLDRVIEGTMVNQRLMAQLSTTFGLLAVLLSAVGIYGLMSYLVGQRTGEIGIRMALGASHTGVRWMVMREITMLVVSGIAAGIVLTLLGGQLVRNMLYGIAPSEPMSLAVAIVSLTTIALAAGYVPARRASRVNPMQALRYE
ncbi:ADOP family duplicated permease [Terriglobus sp. RCC_193]|uniref:ABC transporter permease n=1 Tax=Terriglobus sp. RCC_193 TaxID=3239218 RepID=UPI003523FE72